MPLRRLPVLAHLALDRVGEDDVSLLSKQFRKPKKTRPSTTLTRSLRKIIARTSATAAVSPSPDLEVPNSGSDMAPPERARNGDGRALSRRSSAGGRATVAPGLRLGVEAVARAALCGPRGQLEGVRLTGGSRLAPPVASLARRVDIITPSCRGSDGRPADAGRSARRDAAAADKAGVRVRDIVPDAHANRPLGAGASSLIASLTTPHPSPPLVASDAPPRRRCPHPHPPFRRAGVGSETPRGSVCRLNPHPRSCIARTLVARPVPPRPPRPPRSVSPDRAPAPRRPSRAARTSQRRPARRRAADPPPDLTLVPPPPTPTARSSFASEGRPGRSWASSLLPCPPAAPPNLARNFPREPSPSTSSTRPSSSAATSAATSSCCSARCDTSRICTRRRELLATRRRRGDVRALRRRRLRSGSSSTSRRARLGTVPAMTHSPSMTHPVAPELTVENCVSVLVSSDFPAHGSTDGGVFGFRHRQRRRGGAPDAQPRRARRASPPSTRGETRRGHVGGAPRRERRGDGALVQTVRFQTRAVRRVENVVRGAMRRVRSPVRRRAQIEPRVFSRARVRRFPRRRRRAPRPIATIDLGAHVRRLVDRGHDFRDVYWHVWGATRPSSVCDVSRARVRIRAGSLPVPPHRTDVRPREQRGNPRVLRRARRRDAAAARARRMSRERTRPASSAGRGALARFRGVGGGAVDLERDAKAPRAHRRTARVRPDDDATDAAVAAADAPPPRRTGASTGCTARASRVGVCG